MIETFPVKIKNKKGQIRITVPKVIKDKMKIKFGDYLTVKIEKDDEKNI